MGDSGREFSKSVFVKLQLSILAVEHSISKKKKKKKKKEDDIEV